MKERALVACLIMALMVAGFPTVAMADVLKNHLPETSAKSYVALDGDTGEVLFGKRYDKTFDPATLTQMMTAYLIIEHGNLSEKVVAPAMPAAINSGNTVYIRKNEEFKLSDLLEAIIVYNANDAAYAAAHHIGGDIDKFVKMMNDEAEKLGMSQTVFKSPYGGAKGQKSTALDMARLAAKVSGLEKYVEYTLKPTMNWNGEMFAQENIPNACGFSQIMEDGIGLKLSNEKNENDISMHFAASLSRGGRTVVTLLSGAETEAPLYEEAEQIMSYGIDNTKSMSVIKENTPLTTVMMGPKKQLRVAAARNYSITVPAAVPTRISTHTVLEKVEAPIESGDTLGKVIVYNDDQEIKSIPLVALDDVKKTYNWWKIIVILLAILFILTLLYRSYLRLRRRPKRPPQQKKAALKQAPNAAKRAPKAKTKRRPNTPSRPRVKDERRSNPSVGSKEGRKGLEQKVQERRKLTIHREFPGEDK